jgi:hypothetical protein
MNIGYAARVHEGLSDGQIRRHDPPIRARDDEVHPAGEDEERAGRPS